MILRELWRGAAPKPWEEDVGPDHGAGGRIPLPPPSAFARDHPLNMGPQINTKAFEHFASRSPDGQYLFVCSERNGDLDVYWMSAAIPGHVKQQVGSSR